MVKHGGPGHQLAGFLGENPVDDHHLNFANLGVLIRLSAVEHRCADQFRI